MQESSLPFEQFRDAYLKTGLPLILTPGTEAYGSHHDVVVRLLHDCGDVRVDMLSPTIKSFILMLNESLVVILFTHALVLLFTHPCR